MDAKQITGEQARMVLESLGGEFLVQQFSKEEWQRGAQDEPGAKLHERYVVLEATQDANFKFFDEPRYILIEFPDGRRWRVIKNMRVRKLKGNDE